MATLTYLDEHLLPLRQSVENLPALLPSGKGSHISRRRRPMHSKYELKKVRFLLPEELIAQLDKWARLDPDGGEVERAKPRRQKLQFQNPDMTESERRQGEREMLDELGEGDEEAEEPDA